MKKILIFSLLSNIAIAANEVHHPTPKEPKFLSLSIYDSLRTTVGSVPKDGSKELFLDYGELLYRQETRTDLQCQAARDEVLVSLESFFGGSKALLSAEQIKKLTPVFEQIRNDADYFIQKLKVDLPRPRPFSYIKALKPCVPLEVTKAYPSGHATLASLFARILAEKFPEKKDSLLARAEEIGTHRVLAGMHHRSDVEAGRRLGESLHKHFKNNRSFQMLLK